MAHTRPFGPGYGTGAARARNERHVALLLVALGCLALYIAAGNLDSVAPSTPSFSAETSSLSWTAETGLVSGASSVSTAAVSEAAPEAWLTETLDRWAAQGVVLVTENQAWDEASVTNVDAALSMLQPAVLANLGNRELGPLHILVNGEGRSLSGSQPYGGPANYFSTNDGVNELVLYPGQPLTTVLHELGHAYSLRSTEPGQYASVLVEPEMASFMDATGWELLTSREAVAGAMDHTQIELDYAGGFAWPEVSHFDPLEDYANAFALYHSDPMGLKAASPERYAWMAANLPE